MHLYDDMVGVLTRMLSEQPGRNYVCHIWIARCSVGLRLSECEAPLMYLEHPGIASITLSHCDVCRIVAVHEPFWSISLQLGHKEQALGCAIEHGILTDLILPSLIPNDVVIVCKCK